MFSLTPLSEKGNPKRGGHGKATRKKKVDAGKAQQLTLD